MSEKTAANTQLTVGKLKRLLNRFDERLLVNIEDREGWRDIAVSVDLVIGARAIAISAKAAEGR